MREDDERVRLLCAISHRVHNALVRFSILLSLFALGCSEGKLKAPASDKNFDDGDDPGQMMMGTMVKDGSTDGYIPDGQGKTCASSTECAAPLRCVFPIALGCGAKGTCALFDDPPMCASKLACGCDDKNVSLCSPDGYAPAPVQSSGACAADASAD
jgi:hypothetical protein